MWNNYDNLYIIKVWLYLYYLYCCIVQTRRWCYQCNSADEPDCRKPQSEGPFGKLCPQFEIFCTIFMINDLLIRKCSNVIQCPNDHVRCCSCTENFCNWAENCYEIDMDDDGSRKPASSWLIIGTSITTLAVILFI